MTKAQLIIDLKNMIGPAGKGSEVGNPGFTTWLNDAYELCVSAIINTIPDYFTKKATSSSIANQTEYDLPSDFEKVVMVSVSYDGTNFVRAFPLNSVSQATDIQQSATANFTIDKPFYYLYGGRIGFQPGFTQTLSNNIKLWYVYMPALMVDDEDSPDLPRRFQSILKYGAYANYLDQNDEHGAAERMRLRFDAMVERLVMQLSDQQVDQPRSVEVWEDDQGLYLNDF